MDKQVQNLVVFNDTINHIIDKQNTKT